MPLASGTKLGPYEIQSAIGAGGMGEVYRARNSRLGRDVAIKILAPHTSADPGAVARLAQEARLVAALSHPAIVTIHDVGEEAGQFYLVTELLEGETLRRRLAAGPLPWRRGLDDAITIASALAAAHARGIVHRDLKPENIFCTADGVKILDFGVAKVVALPDAATTIKAAVRTEAGTTVGTLAYMAPEQLDGRPLDHRTDQFAFGILLHEMLAGTRPFGGATTHETVAAILRDEPSSLASLRPELPPALSRIASRCLAKDPQGRYAATADLAVALADVRRDLDAGTAADGRRESPGAHRILPWVAGAVAVAVFVIAATSGFWRATPPDATVTPPSRGLPIIHCHGTPSSRVEGDLTFSGTVAAELGVRIIVPDRPGMGRSDFQPARRIVDWPDDVLQLASALELDTFAVLGSSGGAPYAAACGALIPNLIRVIGLLGGVAPVDAPGMLAAMSAPLRVMVRLSRFAPAGLRGLFGLNLRMMRGGGQRGSERMAASFPEPDRSLLQRPAIHDGFMACFQESCRQGPRGPVWDMGLMARPWGFDLAAIKVPVVLWQGERDRNVPAAHGRYLAGAISTCRATFYPDQAHLSLPLNHQPEILSALAG